MRSLKLLTLLSVIATLAPAYAETLTAYQFNTWGNTTERIDLSNAKERIWAGIKYNREFAEFNFWTMDGARHIFLVTDQTIAEKIAVNMIAWLQKPYSLKVDCNGEGTTISSSGTIIKYYKISVLRPTERIRYGSCRLSDVVMRAN